MRTRKLQSCSELIEYIDKIGFLPLLGMGINGWSAEEVMDQEFQYTPLPNGGWEWPLWKWKGTILQESGCAYGKFFDKKAAFISREWWPDFCNYRRSIYSYPEEGSVEEMILATLQREGSLITRELRAACGFTGLKMRGRFDTYVSRLEMGGYIVTEDFVYPRDRHGREYGWGWSPPPKHSSSGKPVTPTVPRRNPANAWSTTSGKSCPTPTTACSTFC